MKSSKRQNEKAVILPCMIDSTFTFPARQVPFFSHDFHYTGWMVRDTLFAQEAPVQEHVGSFIMTHSPENAFTAVNRSGYSADWIFWIILGGIFLLTLTKFYYEKRLGLLASSVFSRSSANLLIRDSNILRHQSFIYLFFIYLISITLLLHQAFRYADPGTSSSWRELLLYLEIVGAFIAFFLMKITLVRLSGFIFRNTDTATEYIQNMFIFNLFGGIILLPMLLLISYSGTPVFLFIAVGSLVILMFLRFIRGFVVGLSDHKFSLFHLFLYLCTLEILPVVILLKFADKYFFS
jgi:hypothetical protein